MKLIKKEPKKGENAELRFLKEIKKGKYAPIEKSSIPYARMEEREDIITFIEEEEYYYSIS